MSANDFWPSGYPNNMVGGSVPPYYPHDNSYGQGQRTLSTTLFMTPTNEQLVRLVEQNFGNHLPITSMERTDDLLGGSTYTVVAGPNKLIAYVPSDALIADSKTVPTTAQPFDLPDTYLSNMVPPVAPMTKVAVEQVAKKVFTQDQDVVLPDPATVPKRKFNFEAQASSPTPHQGGVPH